MWFQIDRCRPWMCSQSSLAWLFQHRLEERYLHDSFSSDDGRDRWLKAKSGGKGSEAAAVLVGCGLPLGPVFGVLVLLGWTPVCSLKGGPARCVSTLLRFTLVAEPGGPVGFTESPGRLQCQWMEVEIRRHLPQRPRPITFGHSCRVLILQLIMWKSILPKWNSWMGYVPPKIVQC